MGHLCSTQDQQSNYRQLRYEGGERSRLRKVLKHCGIVGSHEMEDEEGVDKPNRKKEA